METQVRILVDQLKDDVSSTCAAKQQVILARIVKFSKKLVRTLLSSVEDEDESNREKVKELIVCLQHGNHYYNFWLFHQMSDRSKSINITFNFSFSRPRMRSFNQSDTE